MNRQNGIGVIRAANRALLLAVMLAWLPACSGEQQAEVIPDRHDRPIVEEDGRRLLWAGEDAEGKVEWFDMTDSTIDPNRVRLARRSASGGTRRDSQNSGLGSRDRR